MAIIKVNDISEENSVRFLTNQSSILHRTDVNSITTNGVNVIVDKPKKGDVMCVTRYTNESGSLLPADDQEVVWIDGLSINPAQLSQHLETVGICVAINGNKAMVKYKTNDLSTNRQFSSTNSIAFNDGDFELTCYFNNGFYNTLQPVPKLAGCCKAMFYYQAQKASAKPSAPMDNIFQIPGRNLMPLRKQDFEDTSNSNCQILRDNFDSYDEYLESMMIKYPCAKGNVGKIPSGKDITYKYASQLFPLLNWAANISVNGPNLGAGNWWIPSMAEMAQIMHDITYGVPNGYGVPDFWDSSNIDNNTDIVNRVLYRLTTSVNGGDNWHMLSANKGKWTSSPCSSIGDGISKGAGAFFYDHNTGAFHRDNLTNRHEAIAITIYEF